MHSHLHTQRQHQLHIHQTFKDAFSPSSLGAGENAIRGLNANAAAPIRAHEGACAKTFLRILSA